MNILIDLLPTKVTIGGKKVKINSDFRTSILFELLMQDEEVPREKLIPYAINLYFNNISLEYYEEAIEKILWFYKCGLDEDSENTKNAKPNSKDMGQIYSFEYDSSYIYAAFLSQYNIDLQDIENLHWWKFKAMFDSLKEDNLIVKIMNYRATDLSQIEDKEERERIKDMKEKFKLPSKLNKEEEEKLKEIEQMLMRKDIQK